MVEPGERAGAGVHGPTGAVIKHPRRRLKDSAVRLLELADGTRMTA